jgi:hypothetical protein
VLLLSAGWLVLQVGLVQSEMTPEARRAAYASDITYVTNSELGFDYLRDNLAGVSQHTCKGVSPADRTSIAVHSERKSMHHAGFQCKRPIVLLPADC